MLLWRTHLATGIGRLVGAGFTTAGSMPVRSDRPTGFESAGEYGWENGFSRPGFDRLVAAFATTGMSLCPLIEPYCRVRKRRDGAALSRADLVPDRDWFGSAYHREYHVHTGSEHLLYCFRSVPGPEDCWCALTLTRRAGERDFSAREKAIVEAVSLAVTPLIGGPLAAFDDPCPTTLPPRLRQVLAGLLNGLSDKEIAKSLGLRVNTVSYYAKTVYRHFGVENRAGLLACWVRRGWNSRCLWVAGV